MNIPCPSRIRSTPKRVPLRTPEERNALMLPHLRFVRWRVRWFLWRHPEVLHAMQRDDLEQEGCMAMLRAAELWDPDKAPFLAYAKRAIQLRLLNVWQARSLVRGTPGEREEFPGEEGEEGVPAREECEPSGGELEDLLTFLPVRWAEVLRRRGQGQTLAQIGEVLGMTRERVRQIETQGVRKLRERVRRGK